jgi:hypothetical protein
MARASAEPPCSKSISASMVIKTEGECEGLVRFLVVAKAKVN